MTKARPPVSSFKSPVEEIMGFLETILVTLILQRLAVRKFIKNAVKSTIFELQQSFLCVFGVAQNF